MYIPMKSVIKRTSVSMPLVINSYFNIGSHVAAVLASCTFYKLKRVRTNECNNMRNNGNPYI